MKKFPGAKQRPISTNFTNRKRERTRAVILHTTASLSDSMYGWFNNPKADASSHLHVDLKGRIEQYVDMDKIAWTSGEGNATTVGVETAGTGNEKWTPAQVKALVKIIRWMAKEYGIPMRKMSSSRSNVRGVGTHRLGVDGNFPTTGDQRGRLQRASKGLGEKWSSSKGKACPGNLRQGQWNAIVRAAQTHRVVVPTVGRAGAACYRSKATGTKNLTRVIGVGKKVRIIYYRGAWAKTLQGDWIKTSKIKAVAVPAQGV